MKRDRKQTFSIRKLTMGTGSILLGITIFTTLTSQEVKASEIGNIHGTDNTSVEKPVETNDEEVQEEVTKEGTDNTSVEKPVETNDEEVQEEVTKEGTDNTS
ncbi:YSIRK-type signal peptide-containing protein, partial [Mammaliicoccus sciuri]